MPAVRRSRLGRARRLAAARCRKRQLGASFGALRTLLAVEQRQGVGIAQAFEPVRCLACASTYAKPTGRGTAAANPGCPECGYLGWLPFSPEAPLRHRFDADRRPHPLA